LVLGQTAQAAGAQAFAIELHSAKGPTVLKKAAPSARPYGFGPEATPSCW
jgi:hypothetical protein